ncbi:probable serine/threonine-protein kinase At1g54610 [Impatiens glandulifera]|uniref:probable serine/threonine-protein kinase At1g54610 n=1 Tax=Impatiens glandulifera TaxID=253017 RepID=UPI001FB086ED|nr:probable serine/threonine-protein kinase At1g54610 [Impatiens glandulifera]XP_047313914.1 probable serine/threonine-protein kinase At1g54610 [Impatiens glandulifera]
MGCLCAKPSTIDDDDDDEENPVHRQVVNKAAASSSSSSQLHHQSRRTSSRRDETLQIKGRTDESEVGIEVNDRRVVNRSRRVQDDNFDDRRRERENSEVPISSLPVIGTFPKANEAEQVAAGWPSWLSTVAGEALKGWVPRRSDTFEKLDKIGQGTYSNVYKARDLINKKVVALKRVRFDMMDPESVRFMAREILILRRLDHPNVIKLEGLVTSRTSSNLYLVFEYMEHDLTGLASLPGSKFSESQVKCYMKQLLSGLDHCHSRGILHRDIKGSNLLIDNHGILKIADFGLASFFDPRRNIPLTSRVVTLWYRPPELLLGATHYGVSIDLWSTGCILGELYAGKPIMPGRTEVEQLHKVFKLCGSPSEDYWRKLRVPQSIAFKPLHPYKSRLIETFRDFPPAALALMQTLLSIDPAHRGSAADAIESQYFSTKPFACDPSCLPKYPPSKEIDAKMREEANRRKIAEGKSQRLEQDRLPRAIAAPKANAELVESMQRDNGQSNTKSRSELFYPQDQTRQLKARKEIDINFKDKNHYKVSHSGPLSSSSSRNGTKHDEITNVPSSANLSTLSSLVASRTLLSEDKSDSNQLDARYSESLNGTGSMRQYERIPYRPYKMSGPLQTENSRKSIRETNPNENGFTKVDKTRFSGPLMVPSNNMEQMLRDHDRRIQEAARRGRLDSISKIQSQETLAVNNPRYSSSR